jgi:hypothetical protein
VTVTETEQRPPAPRRRRRVAAARVAVAVLAILLVLALAAWLGRRTLAREAVVFWLERRGVEADVRVDRLELNGMVGAVTLGDPDAPQVTAPRVEIDWTVGAPWRAGGMGPTPTRVRLVAPVVRARWTGRRLSFGRLDPLIDEFARRPARTDQVGPVILMEKATVRLDSDWGRTTLLGDARVTDGELASLDAVLPAADYRRGDRFARGVEGRVDLATVQGRTRFDLTLASTEVDLPGVSGSGLKLNLRGVAAYPDVGRRSADGPVRMDGAVSLDRVAAGGWSGRGIDASLSFVGEASGAGEEFALSGLTTLEVDGAAVAGPVEATGARVGASGARARLAFDDGAPLWRLDGPMTLASTTLRADGFRGRGLSLVSADLTLGGRGGAVEASGPVLLRAAGFEAGGLTLTGVASRGALDVVMDGPVRLGFGGALTASGGRWPILGAPARDDVPELATLKRALSDFSLGAPTLSLAVGPGGTTLDLPRGVTVRPRSGGTAVVTRAVGPVMVAAPGAAPRGAFDLALQGGGLPEARVRVSGWRMSGAGFQADLSGRAALDFGLGRGVTLDAAGRLATTPAGLTFTASRCTPLSIERLELGENDVTDLTGGLCPAGRPLVTVADGGWRVDGRLTDVSAHAPFLALRFADAQGPLAVRGSSAGLGLTVGVDRARVIDATDPLRFHPMEATGRAALGGQRWTGDFDLSREGAPVGRLALAHDGPSGVGGVEIVSEDLIFAEDGLQPSDLTPLAAELIRSPVTGRVRFDGRVDWTAEPDGGTSGGLLTLDDLDFDSPAGPVEGLSGNVRLTGLAPLETAADQSVTIEKVAALTDATDLTLTFDLDKATLNLDAASVAAAGGTVTLEPTALPLAPDQPWTGVLVLDRIQTGDLISTTGLADRVAIDAVVSGRVPFTWTPGQGATVQGGSLYSVQPGRLSIQREALSGLDAGGGGDAVPPGVVEQLAYQAMENLAFDELTAAMDSTDGGRLALRFHILGRHDPPVRQELRLGWLELIRRDFLNRTDLPLPSDTGIDLTLDVDLNINQLISDLLAVQRAREGNGNSD